MWRKINYLVTIVPVLIILLAWAMYKNPDRAMVELPLGSSYQQLIDMAGEPSYETDGTLWVEPEFKKSKDQMIEGCVKELWYENPLGLPNKYSFCFDEKGILIHKYHWTSW